MDKETANRIIANALSSYIEDCAGAGTPEAEQIEEAWQVIKSQNSESK
jgi:hypothetical protein